MLCTRRNLVVKFEGDVPKKKEKEKNKNIVELNVASALVSIRDEHINRSK